MAHLAGRTAIITGAAQGLGQAFAERLAAEGANVAIFDNLPGVLAVGEAIAARVGDGGPGVLTRVFDITSRQDCETFVADTAARFGGIDILVNNAAVWRSTPVTDPWEKALEDFDAVMDVNVKAVMAMSRLVVPHMIAAGGGDLVNISTDYVLPARRDGVNPPDTDLYTASKWALNGLTDAGAQALAPHNIRVNALCMGPTDTEMLCALFRPGGKLAHLGGPDGPPPEVRAGFMDPADIARLLIDLIRDGRTGENIGVWAGWPIELGPRQRWDVRMRHRADFTGQPLRDFGPPPWTDAPEPVWSLAVGQPEG
jgi:NAD(P)-dependent dehydrogenase (short-subunit alcohol dehydrogenase family)